MASSWEEALQAQSTTLALLTNLGWSVNWEKSSLEPSQAKEFLGLIVDMMVELRFCIKLSQAAIHNLEEWLAGLSKWDGRVVLTWPLDSSTTSMGWWKHCSQHINKLELKAVHQALKALLPCLWGKLILLHCNNVTAVVYIKHLVMNCMTHKIFDLCEHHNIQLLAIHLPGVENNRADHLSWLYPQHKWRLASSTSSTTTVDATAQDWCGETNWATPPITLIPCVLRLLQQQHTSATIITLVWPGRPWFQDLCQMSTTPPIPIPNIPDLFKWQGLLPPKPLHNPHWRWAAFKICGDTEQKAGLGWH
ncbi:uncharacterized protein ACA1_325410 [Acanthamoeba castellanii str. Neff]|uniref:RNase H type-1 domain-containing protein n=1 Tax=Acanthamoeba castellanii (strain ATCC 30010 / Neff) TaxID=1257118 RepID=L8H8X4_ACACF|nr:uncharacterized protein ACA1_325410 [Acanthamoeba castellanii str. Neff]ELR21969.1 hypothetical protein ACA1_325410 [Acanthamoeba castellanii str. Neff]